MQRAPTSTTLLADSRFTSRPCSCAATSPPLTATILSTSTHIAWDHTQQRGNGGVAAGGTHQGGRECRAHHRRSKGSQQSQCQHTTHIAPGGCTLPHVCQTIGQVRNRGEHAQVSGRVVGTPLSSGQQRLLGCLSHRQKSPPFVFRPSGFFFPPPQKPLQKVTTPYHFATCPGDRCGQRSHHLKHAPTLPLCVAFRGFVQLASACVVCWTRHCGRCGIWRGVVGWTCA